MSDFADGAAQSRGAEQPQVGDDQAEQAPGFLGEDGGGH